MKHHIIKRAKPDDLSGLRMWIEFDDDPKAVVDLTEIFAQGGVFTPLRAFDRFAAVEITPDGDALFWRTGDGEDDIVDLCADALWLQAHPEDGAAAAALSSPRDQTVQPGDQPIPEHEERVLATFGSITGRPEGRGLRVRRKPRVVQGRDALANDGAPRPQDMDNDQPKPPRERDPR